MQQTAIFILIVILLAGCQQAARQITTGVTQELARYRKSTISELQYELSFRIPEKQGEKIEASAVILFNLKNINQNLQIDFKGDTTAIYTIICNGNTFESRILKGHLLIEKSLLKRGKNQIQLQFVAPDWSLNRNPEFLYTLFVPDRASTAFPCFDQPDLKAQFSLELEIPVKWKAVANGSALLEETHDSVKTIRFNPTKPLPTYLFAFTTGIFDTVSQSKNGRTYVLYHREKEEEVLRNNVDSIFNLLFRSISEIEKYTAMKYPFEKYDFVAIPSFQYNGMEHPGVTLYRASSLFVDAKNTRQQLLKRANLIAHETAHMWFGDFVTMPWFDEVWLKEVFANFIADKVIAPVFPEFNFDLLFQLAHFDAAYSVDRTAGANPIGQKLSNMKDAGSLYGSIIYHKAPIVMKMLEQKIGEEKLKNGLRKYLSQNNYSNAGWNELIEILDPQKSDELSKWSDIWVNAPGRPKLKGTLNGKALTVEQSDPSGKGRIWPLELEVAHSDKGIIMNRKVVLNSEKTIIEDFLTNENFEWIYLNTKGYVYGFVEIDPVSQSHFLDHLSFLEDDLLRASVLTDLTENLYEKKLSCTKYLEMILQSLQKESNPVIYERMLSYLETCFIFQSTDEQRSAICNRMEIVLWDEYGSRKSQRPAIINSLIKLASTNRSQLKLQHFFAGNYSKDDLALSPDQQYDLALQLALKLPEKATEILDKQESRMTNADKRESFHFIRQSVHPDRSARDRFFNELLEAKNREHEPWVDQSMSFLNHPIRQKESLQYLRPSLDKLIEIQQTGDIFFPKSWLDNLLKGHSSPDASLIVKQFLSDHPSYPEDLKMKILQSADHLLRQ